VPTSTHCDHLIEAETGAAQDLESAKVTNKVRAGPSLIIGSHLRCTTLKEQSLMMVGRV
jgi:hypothetical protein